MLGRELIPVTLRLGITADVRRDSQLPLSILLGQIAIIASIHVHELVEVEHRQAKFDQRRLLGFSSPLC